MTVDELAQAMSKIQTANTEALATISAFLFAALDDHGIISKAAVIDVLAVSENPILRGLAEGLRTGAGPSLRVIDGGKSSPEPE